MRKLGPAILRMTALLLLVSGVGCAGRYEASAPARSEVGADSPDASAIDQPAPEPDSELAGSSWEMMEIQSMNDTRWVPDDPARYTLVLADDGSAYMQFDCNRGRGLWHSDGPGHLRFGPVASTNALCQDDGLAERYAAQFEYVRSYVLRDGHLHLATLADGAIIEFRPVSGSSSE